MSGATLRHQAVLEFRNKRPHTQLPFLGVPSGPSRSFACPSNFRNVQIGNDAQIRLRQQATASYGVREYFLGPE